MRIEGRPILCHLCQAGGGTLVKEKDGQYRHQKPEKMCRRKEEKDENSRV